MPSDRNTAPVRKRMRMTADVVRSVIHSSSPPSGPLSQHVNSKRRDESRNEQVKRSLWNPSKKTCAAECSRDHACGCHHDDRNDGHQLASLDEEVDGHSRAIDKQRDGGGGGNERIARQIESEERGGADSALISDEAAEKAGKSAGDPGHWTTEPHPPCQTC